MLCVVVLAACSIPKRFDVKTLVGKSELCFRDVPQERLTNMIDTCPLLSRTTRQVNPDWNLYLLPDGETEPEWWASDGDNIDAKRDCHGYFILNESLKVGSSTHLFVNDVKTMWDYENGHRVTIFGTTHLHGRSIKFAYEETGIAPLNPKKALQRAFHQCSSR